MKTKIKGTKGCHGSKRNCRTGRFVSKKRSAKGCK